MQSTRQHDFSVAIYTETGITNKLTDINSSRKPYISPTQLRAAPNAGVSLFTQIPVIALPCNAEYCTGQHTVDRSLDFLSALYQQRKGRSWRPCLPACPFGQDREFPRHSIYSIVKDHERTVFCPLTSTGKKIGVSTTKTKIFFYFLNFAILLLIACCVMPIIFAISG